MNDEATLPPLGRRHSDLKISELERKLQENTDLTTEAHRKVEQLSGTVTQIKTGTDALLDMKQTVEGHITVMCTWARWLKRIALFVVPIILPGLVAAKQLGLL